MRRESGDAFPLLFAALPVIFGAKNLKNAKRDENSARFVLTSREITKNPPWGDVKTAQNVSNCTIDNCAPNEYNTIVGYAQAFQRIK